LLIFELFQAYLASKFAKSAKTNKNKFFSLTQMQYWYQKMHNLMIFSQKIQKGLSGKVRGRRTKQYSNIKYHKIPTLFC